MLVDLGHDGEVAREDRRARNFTGGGVAELVRLAKEGAREGQR